MSDKPRSVRVEEQQIISSFVEMLERYSQVADCESQGSPIKFIRHDGYTFSIPVRNGKKLVIKFEIG